MNNFDLTFLEKQRFSYRWKHILCSVLGWLLLAIAVFIGINAFFQTDDVRLGLYLFYSVAAFFSAGVFALLVWLIKKKYAAFYRKHINGKIIPLAFPDLYYSEESHLPFEELRQSGLVLNFSDRESEGYGLLSGLWNDINFQLSSFHLQEVRRGKSQSNSIIFSGMIMVATRQNDVNGTVAITQDIAERFFGGAVGEFFQNLNAKARRQQLVKIDNPAFEKKFAVYADHHTEAIQFLTPSFCEWLLKQQLNQEQNAASKMTGIEVSIQPDKIYIAWKSQDPSKADELTETVQTPITSDTIEKTRTNITKKLATLKELFDLLNR